MDPDKELVERAKDGDEAAFESLVAKYKATVFNVIYSVLGAAAEADDIAQEAFLKAYFSLRSFKGASNFSTWLYRIAVNESLTAARKRKHRFASPAGALSDEDVRRGVELISDGGEGLEERAQRAENRELVGKLLRALPGKYRVIVTLRDIEGLSYEEIARVMDISTDKVKVWLFRARRQLKEMLDAAR